MCLSPIKDKRSHAELFLENIILKYFIKLIGKHLQWNPFFSGVADWACKLTKYWTPLQAFPMNFANFVRTVVL